MRLFVKEALASLDPSDCRKLPRPSNGSEWRFLPAQRRSAVDRSLESNGKQLEALIVAMGFYVMLGLHACLLSAMLMICSCSIYLLINLSANLDPIGVGISEGKNLLAPS